MKLGQLLCGPGPLAAAVMVFSAWDAAAQSTPPNCLPSPDYFANEPPPARAIASLAAGQTVRIVAIGGASTLGRAADGPANAWPARLAAALAVRFPTARVEAENKAVARKSAPEMLARFERDVLALRPSVVIWETGTTDAVRGEDVDIFRDSLRTGIDRVRAAGAEIVLMDMQFSQRANAVISLDRYVDAMGEVAYAADVPLFRRHALMRDWAENGVFDFEVRDREKRKALARRLYDCIGRTLALLFEPAAVESTTAPAPGAPPAERPRTP